MRTLPRFVPRRSAVFSLFTWILFLGPWGSLATAQGYLLWEVNGAGPGSNLGYSIAPTGDVNGDGVSDVIAGAPVLGAPPSVGQAKLLSGSTGTTLLSIIAAPSHFAFGYRVAGPGDLNGDGVSDFLVGSALNFSSIRVTAYSGANGAFLYFVVPSTVTPVLEALSGAGDVNADGVQDFIVGINANQQEGIVKVYSGTSGATLITFSGTFVQEHVGKSVTGVGDLNGDGHDDVVVGSPAWNTGVPTSAKVISGATGGLLYTVIGSPNSALIADMFGQSVAAMGDVTGDGVQDFAVGAPSSTAPQYVRAFSGATGATLFTAYGTGSFGHSLAGVGDVNGDGIPDLAAGDPYANVSPMTGWQGGQVRVLSGATGATLFKFDGTPPDVLGWSIAGAGDLNGDGIPEIAAGAPYATGGGLIDAGQVRVFSVAGIPQGSGLFGAGCPGSGGTTPLIQTAGGNPSASIGNPSFSLVLSRALPNAPALLIGGTSNTFWSTLGIPLPVNLALLGFPACSLAVSPEVLIPTSTTADGIEFTPMPVPANAALVGQSVYFQWFVLDPPGAMTQGLEVVL